MVKISVRNNNIFYEFCFAVNISPFFSFSLKKIVLFRKQKNMKKIAPFLFLILAVILLVSCSKSIVFDEMVVFPDNNWAFENKAITFEAPLTSSEKPFAVFLELELVGTPNVDMFDATFTLFTPKGGKTIKSLVFNFSSPQEPYIKGKLPNEKVYKMTVYPQKYFSETGTYTFEVNQFSNKADNYNIRALRLYIERVKEK